MTSEQFDKLMKALEGIFIVTVIETLAIIITLFAMNR